MSKEFTLEPGGVDIYHANNFVTVTKNSEKYLYKPSRKSKGRYFGYCTGGCDLKVFRSKPTTEGGDYFFKHVKGYYTPSEQHRMLSCRYYEPVRGKAEQPIPLSPIYLDEITNFIKENSYWIFRYINSTVINNLGVMSANYYIKILKNIFVDNINNLSTSDRISTRLLPYNIFELMFGCGKMYFREMNPKTINFDKVKKDLLSKYKIKYFDYFLFVLTGKNLLNNILTLEVIQEKDFKGYLDRPRSLQTIEIPLNHNGLVQYISKYKSHDKKNFLLSDSEIYAKYPKNQADIIISNKLRYEKIDSAINAMF